MNSCKGKKNKGMVLEVGYEEYRGCFEENTEVGTWCREIEISLQKRLFIKLTQPMVINLLTEFFEAVSCNRLQILEM